VILMQDVLTIDKVRNCRDGVLLGACVDVGVIAGTWLDVSSWNTQETKTVRCKCEALSDPLNV
jgi:hypothetical protein